MFPFIVEDGAIPSFASCFSPGIRVCIFLSRASALSSFSTTMSDGGATATEDPSSENAASQPDDELSTVMEKMENLTILHFSSGSCHEQDEASNGTVATTLKTPSLPDSGSPSSSSQSSSQATTFVRQKKGWTPKEQYRLKNSLLAGVGLLELGNAGDFAANVWNQIPIPHFAMALSQCPSIL